MRKVAANGLGPQCNHYLGLGHHSGDPRGDPRGDSKGGIGDSYD